MTKAVYDIVGMKHAGPDTEAYVRALPAGTALGLVRDPENRYDFNAVIVMHGERRLGFIKSTQVRPLARLMDASPGKAWFGRLIPAVWPQIEVDE